MRSTEIFQVLEDSEIAKPWSYLPGDSSLTDLDSFRRRYALIRKIPGFEDLFSVIDKSIIFRTALTSLQIPSTEWKHLNNAWSLLLPQLRGLHRYLKAIVSNEDAFSVFIKIPDTSNLHQITRDMEKIDTLLSQIVLDPDINGAVELRGWEKGSFWIEIYLKSELAIILVGKVVNAALLIHRESLKNRVFTQLVEVSGAAKEHKLAMLEAQKKQLDLLLSAEANSIFQSAHSPKVDHEGLERLKHSIREFAMLIEKGLEIHPSLTAPSSAKGLFPDFKHPELATSKTPQIESSDSGSSP